MALSKKKRGTSQKPGGARPKRWKGLLLGAHMSIAGGVSKAVTRGEALGCTAIQIFTKNASQWNARALNEEEVGEFRAERLRTGMYVVAHDAYLINLASPNKDLLAKSRAAFLQEMERAEALGIPYLVMHPGAHTGAGEDRGLKLMAESFNFLLRKTRGFQVRIAVENTAGQGTVVGYSIEHLKRILENTVDPERMATCLDTCHAFAAGYDLRDSSGYEKFVEKFDSMIGLNKLKVMHLNDCKKELGRRVDRHEHIGKGMLGLECFRRIMNDPLLRDVPKLLETPKLLDGQDMDPINLAILRDLAS
ncbi:MAG: deoxyribonuclease IV [Desulfomonile tiedjei]|nr:deoxyribonuclease IV [Desulfomonile tiedjei]